MNSKSDHIKSLLFLVNFRVRYIDAVSNIIHVNGLEMLCSIGSVIANMGSIRIVMIIAPNPPTDTILITSFDLPSNTILCPGSIDVAVPSCGTPNNIDGTNSIRAWAIDIDTISTHKNSGDTIVSRFVDAANIIAPAVLTCMPGIIPVVVPINIPMKHAIINSIMDYSLFEV